MMDSWTFLLLVIIALESRLSALQTAAGENYGQLNNREIPLADYNYRVLLEIGYGLDTEMDELQRKAITRMYATLRRSLDPEPLLAELLSAGLVTFDQFEDISSLSKGPGKNSRILQLVMNHGSSEAFRIFCECIEKADSAQKFLADNLKGA